jgi:hypothetical protein
MIKVICIKNTQTPYSKWKEPQKLSPGNIYYADIISYNGNEDDKSWHIYRKNEFIGYTYINTFLKKYFLTMAEFREYRINKILND